VTYAEGEAASSLALMFGGLIAANLAARPGLGIELKAMEGRVGIEVTDLDDAVTLEFGGGRLLVRNGLRARRKLTVSAESKTLMNLGKLKLTMFGVPDPRDQSVREIATEVVTGRLRVDGLPFNLLLLNRLTRLFAPG
jgi:hypothetical protein